MYYLKSVCFIRVGFRAIVEKFNNTVRRRCPGTTPLTLDALIECWSIFCVLKLVQEAGTIDPNPRRFQNPNLTLILTEDGPVESPLNFGSGS